MNIIESIQDENLFKSFLGDDLESWKNWIVALKAVYGLGIYSKASREVAKLCTGREALDFPDEGFNTALFLTGRRSGKSRTAAVIGAYEAVLAGHEKKLSKGEHGVVIICAPSKSQGRIVKDYLRSIFEVEMLRDEIVGETKSGFDLANGSRIEIQAGDWRTIRGFTVLAAIVDEACFFGYDAESNVKSDTELVRALQPALATVNGKLICISSPYARKGWCYSQYKRNFGNDAGKVLVWNAPSKTMNPLLLQSKIDQAMEEDLAAAKSEYLGEFRDDIAAFIPRAVVEQLVVPGRKELPPERRRCYSAFVDMASGSGSGDDATLAIAHREDRKVVIDLLRRYRPPFNAHAVVAKMAETIAQYHTFQVTGDNWAAGFVARAFEGCGIRYLKSSKNKNILYAELLPRLCSGEIELLDDETLVNQLASLERRTRAGGRDQIDHPQGHGHHDDLSNAVAGVAEVASVGTRRIGGMIPSPKMYSLTGEFE